MTVTTPTHTSFLGIKVEGDITRGRNRTEQRPLSELEPLIRAVLDDETIVEFGWAQYTPYFNDGEPCEFSASEVWVRTVTDPALDDDDTDEQDTLSVEYGHPSLGEIEWEYIGAYPNRERHIRSYTGPDRARLERCLALSDAITGNAFNDVLLDAFGDHASVVVRRDGISVTFYEHD